MPELVLKSTGEVIDVAPENLSRAMASGLYEAPSAGTSAQIATPQGIADVSAESLSGYQQAYGDQAASSGEVAGLERESYLGRKHGGAAAAAGTFVEQAANEATFGLTGFVGEQLAGEEYRENMEGRAELHDEAATVGGIAGVVAPALVTGGAGLGAKILQNTGAGIAARAGESIAAKAVGRGIVAETAAKAAGYGVEGALLGSGHVLAETILRDKELSAEAFIAGAKEGGFWGASAGGATALLSRGTKWAKSSYDKAQAAAADVKTLAAEQKAAAKAAEADAKALAKLKLEQERHINRVGMEELRQKGRLQVVEARTGAKKEIIDAATAAKLEALEAQAAAKKDFAGFTTEQRLKLEEYRQAGKESLAQIGSEARLKLADKATEKAIAQAEARVAVSRAKLEGISERLAAEQERTARAKLIMEGRLQIADTYTGGWKRAAESREAVAASKLDAAGLGADARTRVGLADALVKSGRSDAGILVEELIPARMRTPKAIDAAKSDVVVQAARMQSTTERLVQQADELMMVNPAAAEELRILRDVAAETSPAVEAWSQKATSGADDFAEGFRTIRNAEQAQHDLAQAMRQQAGGMPTPELDLITKGMDDAVGKTDEITETALAKQINAASEATPANANAADATGALGVIDTMAMVGGLPNADDIPVIGPVLGAYLKFRAAHGVLGKLGVRLPGPVGRIAQIGAEVQNKASDVVTALVTHAPTAARVVERSSPSLASTLSRPLWEPLEAEASHKPAGKYDPMSAYKKRLEELDRAMGDPDGTRQKIQESIPAPPTVAAAVADTEMRKLEYLHSLVSTDPRAPTITGRRAEPNRVEVNRFAEAKSAVENPVESIKDFIDGHVGPAVVDAVKAVFPRLYQSMQEQMVEKLSELDGDVAYPRLVRAALVFDLPLSHATTPQYANARQAEYAAQAQAAPQPNPGGAQLRLSQMETLGTRAVR